MEMSQLLFPTKSFEYGVDLEQGEILNRLIQKSSTSRLSIYNPKMIFGEVTGDGFEFKTGMLGIGSFGVVTGNVKSKSIEGKFEFTTLFKVFFIMFYSILTVIYGLFIIVTLVSDKTTPMTIFPVTIILISFIGVVRLWSNGLLNVFMVWGLRQIESILETQLIGFKWSLRK